MKAAWQAAPRAPAENIHPPGPVHHRHSRDQRMQNPEPRQRPKQIPRPTSALSCVRESSVWIAATNHAALVRLGLVVALAGAAQGRGLDVLESGHVPILLPRCWCCFHRR